MAAKPRDPEQCIICAAVYARTQSYRQGAEELGMDRMTFKNTIQFTAQCDCSPDWSTIEPDWDFEFTAFQVDGENCVEQSDR